MMPFNENQSSISSDDLPNRHIFSIYENRNGKILDYIGQTEAADAVEAFKIIIARRHKLDIKNETIECVELDEDLCQIWFRETEYMVKIKLNL